MELELEITYINGWEKKREDYLSRVIVDETHKEDLMKALFPKYIASFNTDDELEFNQEIKGDSREEVINKAKAWLTKLQEKIQKIISEN